MHIRIEPCARWIADKYLAAGGKTLFSFAENFSALIAFHTAIGKGLRLIEKAVGAPDHFTFYAARHSWATIARSRLLNIDKWTVHEGLNHVDSEMRVTDGYIERDYGNIWDANARILAVFDWSKLEAREMLR